MLNFVKLVILTNLQVDHFDDQLKSLSSFSEASDVKTGPCVGYLELLIFQIVSKCLVRHSRCATSEMVCIHFVNVCQYFGNVTWDATIPVLSCSI